MTLMIDDVDHSPNTFTMPCLMTYEIVRVYSGVPTVPLKNKIKTIEQTLRHIAQYIYMYASPPLCKSFESKRLTNTEFAQLGFYPAPVPPLGPACPAEAVLKLGFEFVLPLSLNLLPSISPLKPRFCKPMTELIPPVQISFLLWLLSCASFWVSKSLADVATLAAVEVDAALSSL
jgi:hypothetical protein